MFIMMFGSTRCISNMATALSRITMTKTRVVCLHMHANPMKNKRKKRGLKSAKDKRRRMRIKKEERRQQQQQEEGADAEEQQWRNDRMEQICY